MWPFYNNEKLLKSTLQRILAQYEFSQDISSSLLEEARSLLTGVELRRCPPHNWGEMALLRGDLPTARV